MSLSEPGLRDLANRLGQGQRHRRQRDPESPLVRATIVPKKEKAENRNIRLRKEIRVRKITWRAEVVLAIGRISSVEETKPHESWRFKDARAVSMRGEENSKEPGRMGGRQGNERSHGAKLRNSREIKRGVKEATPVIAESAVSNQKRTDRDFDSQHYTLLIG